MSEPDKLKYFIVENDATVCEGIIARMRTYTDWESLGFATGVTKAIQMCGSQRPDLLFMDWSLAGGSAYEVLDAIRALPDYDPYIICFTGYQGDNPDVPMVLINRYGIDKYIIKPIWAHLREGLPFFLEAAVQKKEKRRPDHHLKEVWFRDTRNVHHHLAIGKLAAASTCPDDPRCKLLYFLEKKEPVCVRKSWQQLTELLEAQHIDYYMPNARTQLVVRPYIERYQSPSIFIKGLPCRFEVVSERAKAFEQWLCKG